MSEIKLKSITIRLFIVYFLDSAIIGILFSFNVNKIDRVSGIEVIEKQ
jgi:hypothetical protein